MSEPWVVRRNFPDTWWWRAERCGYTRRLLEAGVYTEEEARHLTRDGHKGMPLSEAIRRYVQPPDGTVAEHLEAQLAEIAAERDMMATAYSETRRERDEAQSVASMMQESAELWKRRALEAGWMPNVPADGGG